MTTNINSDDKRRLEQLVRSGRFATEEEALSSAIQLLDESANASSGQQSLSPDEWRKAFRRATETLAGGNPDADYSRDRIYGETR